MKKMKMLLNKIEQLQDENNQLRIERDLLQRRIEGDQITQILKLNKEHAKILAQTE